MDTIVSIRSIIEVDAVSKRFGSICALDGVTLSMGRGEVVGLLGPNGAGKTTLVLILATLLRPDSGRVSVAGHDAATAPDDVRRSIGLAGQFAAVDELLTGRENLELIAGLYGLDRGERRRRAETMLARLDLLDAADRRVGAYSGGMRRRLDLGATLVGRPEVVLLDEPTAGLDPRSRSEIWRLVDQLVADGATVLLTSQYMEELERLATRIVVLDRGTVIAEGSPDDLKRKIGGDVLEARIAAPGDLDTACRLMTELGSGSAHVDADEQRVWIPTTGGTAVLVAAARGLDDAGVALADLGLRRPSLDDVFLALTGEATTAAPRRGVVAVAPAPDLLDEMPVEVRRSPWRGMLAITKRYLVRLRRNPQLLFFSVVQPVLIVLALDAVFGALVTGDNEGTAYLQYLLPGVVVMNVMLLAGTTAYGLAEDLQAGVIDRFRSLPMSRSAVLVGRTLADLVRNVVSLTAVLTVGFAMGYRLRGGILAGLAAVGLVLLFAYAVSWMFASVGLAVKDPATAQFAGFAPVLPLVYLSGAWIPVTAMAGDLQAFARNQPVNVVIEAVRALAGGAPAASWVWRSIAWSVVILAVFWALAVRQYRKA